MQMVVALVISLRAGCLLYPLGSPPNPLRLSLGLTIIAIESCPHRLARLEVDVRPGFDHHPRAGARVPSGTGFAGTHAERPEVAQLDAITIRQCTGDPAEDRIHHRLDLLRVEVRLLLRDTGDEFGPDHG